MGTEKIPAAALADLLGISERRVKELRAAGVLPGAAGERYAMRDSVRAYCRHLRPAAGRSAAGGSDTLTLNSARIEVLAEQATRLRLENDLTVKRVVPVADVQRAIAGCVSTVRSRLLAIPSGHAERLARIASPQAMHGALERVIVEALEELSNPSGPLMRPASGGEPTSVEMGEELEP